MKIQQYGPETEELKRKGKSYQQIAEQVGLGKKQVWAPVGRAGATYYDCFSKHFY